MPGDIEPDDWLDLLPIHGLGPLLAHLAARWRAILDADAVCLSALSVERTRLFLAVADQTGTRHADVGLKIAGDWSPKLVVDALPRAFPSEAELAERFAAARHRVPITLDGTPPAGTLAVSQSPPDDALLARTARLLAQGRAHQHLLDDLESAKLEAMVEFAAGAGHEINNPLATINGRVQLLLRNETDPERRRALEVIGGQAYRVRDMIGDAMLFGRPPEPEPRPVDLGEAVTSAIDALRPDQRRNGVRIDFAPPPEAIAVQADPTQLRVVLSELIRNALEAVADAGTVTIRLTADARKIPRFAVAQITDDGPGLSTTDREHLFDPFYSGRQAGRGLGFGLSKAWRIARLHGGRIDVDSTEKGTTARVFWPM